MNHKQKIVIWAAIAVIALMCLFPPWIKFNASRTSVYGQSYTSIGYRPIFLPPKTTSNITGFSIDLKRLFVQIFVVVIVVSGYLVTFEKHRKREDTKSVLSILSIKNFRKYAYMTIMGILGLFLIVSMIFTFLDYYQETKPVENSFADTLDPATSSSNSDQKESMLERIKSMGYRLPEETPLDVFEKGRQLYRDDLLLEELLEEKTTIEKLNLDSSERQRLMNYLVNGEPQRMSSEERIKLILILSGKY